MALFFFLRRDWTNKKPTNAPTEISFINGEWVLLMNKGSKQSYTEARILLHNELFQLLQLTNAHQKRIIVLFQDQVSTNQLRLLHLKIAQSSI